MKTVFLAGPVTLRTREEDPDGMPPVDVFGQPAKNRDGSLAKPFKIIERHLKRGANSVPNDVADHPYIRAHAIEAPRGAADDFTVEQLEAMLAAKRESLLASKKAAPKPSDKQPGAANGDDLPYPDDAAIYAMTAKELRGLINASGGTDRGVKDVDLVQMAISLRPAKK